jgi:hypothetical protein
MLPDNTFHLRSSRVCASLQTGRSTPGENGPNNFRTGVQVTVFKGAAGYSGTGQGGSARRSVDRIAAVVGAVVFAAGVAGIGFGVSASSADPAPVRTTVVSSPVPGDAETMTVRTTAPPTRPTLEPRVTEETTVTQGSAAGSVVVTTSPAAAGGLDVTAVTIQFILVTLAALLAAFATHVVLLGRYGPGPRAALAAGSIGVDDAAEVKAAVAAAGEARDLSRPLFDAAGVPDTRLRLLQSRIALELEVRRLASHHDLPSGLTIPFVVKGLVDKKRMTPRLAGAIVELGDIGDRLSRGADLSADTTTLLTEAYAQALAKVGGKIK